MEKKVKKFLDFIKDNDTAIGYTIYICFLCFMFIALLNYMLYSAVDMWLNLFKNP